MDMNMKLPRLNNGYRYKNFQDRYKVYSTSDIMLYKWCQEPVGNISL